MLDFGRKNCIPGQDIFLCFKHNNIRDTKRKVIFMVLLSSDKLPISEHR